MEGLNNIREAYQQVYSQIDEKMDDDAKEMRRLAAQERKAGKSDRMPAKIASKYADSESRSASRADKKSKGKHIHGYAMEETEVEDHPKRTRKPSQIAKMQKLKKLLDSKKETAKEEYEIDEAQSLPPQERLKTDREGYRVPQKDADAARERALAKSAVMRAKKGINKEEVELSERELDPTETKEKERLVHGLKKSASDFKARYGKRAKSVMYATATKMAKDRMDTSKSDRRYSVER